MMMILIDITSEYKVVVCMLPIGLWVLFPSSIKSWTHNCYPTHNQMDIWMASLAKISYREYIYFHSMKENCYLCSTLGRVFITTHFWGLQRLCKKVKLWFSLPMLPPLCPFSNSRKTPLPIVMFLTLRSSAAICQWWSRTIPVAGFLNPQMRRGLGVRG